jgi:hypothetical protein
MQVVLVSSLAFQCRLIRVPLLFLFVTQLKHLTEKETTSLLSSFDLSSFISLTLAFLWTLALTRFKLVGVFFLHSDPLWLVL